MTERVSGGVSINRGVPQKHGGINVTEYLKNRDVSKVTFGFVEYGIDASTGAKSVQHPGTEILVLMEGSIVAEVDGQSYKLTAGDCIEFDGSLPHRGWNPDDKDAKAIFLYLYY